MKHFLVYLLQSSACVAVLWSVYGLFLRKDTFFRTNRFFLLMIAVASMVLPLIKMSLEGISRASGVAVYLAPVVITPEKIEQVVSGIGNVYVPVIALYLAGVSFFLVKLIIRLVQLYLLIGRHCSKVFNNVTIVTVDSTIAPFSFFHWVFINDSDAENPSRKQIFSHEMVHVRQWHSADLFLTELLLIFQWFNPFAWLLMRSVKTNHEYLADEGVLKGEQDRHVYQELLLTRSAGFPVYSFANNFNVSLLKKRIIMMARSRSSMFAKGKILFAVPAVFAVLFFFSSGSMNRIAARTIDSGSAERNITMPQPGSVPIHLVEDAAKAESKSSPDDSTVFTVVENPPAFKGGQDAMVKYLIENVKYPDDAKKNNVQGTVIVEFIVKSDGSVKNARIVRGIGSGCDEEALRVVKQMPKWNPGTMRGKAVNVAFNLPIKFQLNCDKEKTQKKESK
jgi:TonB family protein